MAVFINELKARIFPPYAHTHTHTHTHPPTYTHTHTHTHTHIHTHTHTHTHIHTHTHTYTHAEYYYQADSLQELLSGSASKYSTGPISEPPGVQQQFPGLPCPVGTNIVSRLLCGDCTETQLCPKKTLKSYKALFIFECFCSVHSRNLHNLEIVLRILRIQKLHANLCKIAQPILRLHNTFARSQDCASTICEHNRLTD